MTKRIPRVGLVLACLAGPVLAGDISLTVHPGRVVNRIDEKVYGHFLEHIYHSCNGGLWGELVWDRSFEGAGAGVAWQREGDCIAQRGAASNVRLVFGDPTWTDYEFTVEARKTGDLIAASKNPKLKIYVSEWNAQSTDWRTGLYCGGLLNAFERCGDVVEMGGPALFLRHVSAGGWDNALVNFDHRTWFPAPNYVVMKLWREHYAPRRIALEGETGPLNAVATQSADGRTLCLKAVNPKNEAVSVKLNLSRGAIDTASMQVVAPGALTARNSLDAPGVVRPVPAPVRRSGRTAQFTLPALSCGVVRIRCSPDRRQDPGLAGCLARRGLVPST